MGPLIKELLRRVEDNPEDKTAKEMATMMFNTATLRSGFSLKDTVNFAESIEKRRKSWTRNHQRRTTKMRKRRRMKKMLLRKTLPRTSCKSGISSTRALYSSLQNM